MQVLPGILAVFALLASVAASAQISVKGIALKSGETTEMGAIYWIARAAGCRSLLEKIEGVEVLEGPPNLTVTYREEMVKPRDCAKKVPGGIVVVSAKTVDEVYHGKLVYRIKYKTKDGDRQSSYIYELALYP